MVSPAETALYMAPTVPALVPVSKITLIVNISTNNSSNGGVFISGSIASNQKGPGAVFIITVPNRSL